MGQKYGNIPPKDIKKVLKNLNKFETTLGCSKYCDGFNGLSKDSPSVIEFGVSVDTVMGFSDTYLIWVSVPCGYDNVSDKTPCVKAALIQVDPEVGTSMENVFDVEAKGRTIKDIINILLNNGWKNDQTLVDTVGG